MGFLVPEIKNVRLGFANRCIIFDVVFLCRCAMALVHSRIRRVFYVNATRGGSLGTFYKLHVQEGLNHHFEVFNMTNSDASEQLHTACSRNTEAKKAGSREISQSKLDGVTNKCNR